nr:MAG TPA: hypothetical protein [Caudoviricetes sp.]
MYFRPTVFQHNYNHQVYSQLESVWSLEIC